MKAILKRAIAIICTASLAGVYLPQSALRVEAKSLNTGILRWDFENKSDFGYYVVGEDEVQERKSFESGAWCREAGSWNSGEIKSRMYPYQALVTASGCATTTGGQYCAEIDMTNEWKKRRSLGMAITLSEKELIPSRSYMLEFDACVSVSWQRWIYAGFSKPSKRTTSTLIADSDGAAWLAEGECVRVTPNDGNTGVTNERWSHLSVSLTPSENMYESGNIILYIAGADLGSNGVGGDEKLFLDNITLTPADPRHDEPVFRKVSYGKMWDFEEGAAVSGNGSITYKNNIIGQYEDGLWAPLNNRIIPGADTYMVPRYMQTDKIKMYKNASDNHGYNGAKAPGSMECIAIQSGTDSDYIIGTKIKLSRDNFSNSTYILSLNAASTSLLYNLKAAAFRGEKDIVTADESGGSAVTASLTDAVCDWDLGMVGSFWSEYRTNITFDDSFFDEDGYCTLVLYMGDGLMDMGECLFLDDISLSSYAGLEMQQGKKVTGYITTVFDNSVSNIMTTVSVKNPERLLSVEVCNGSAKPVSYANFSVNIPNDADDPLISIYTWNKDTLKPFAEPMSIRKTNEFSASECVWQSEWVDVQGNRYEEAEGLITYTSDTKTANIKTSSDILLGVKVYTDNTSYMYENNGYGNVDVKVPISGNYYVDIAAKNTTDNTSGVIGKYAKAEFENLTQYPVEAITAGTKMLYRASFEYEDFRDFSVADGVKYAFSSKAPNSGSKCLYISKRTSASQDVRMSVPKLAGSTGDVTLYVRNDSPGAKKRYLLSTITVDLQGRETTKKLSIFTHTDDEKWMKISMSLDFSAYAISDLSDVIVSISELGTANFYVDDFKVTTSADGYIRDDMDYAYYALDCISSTPNTSSNNQEDINNVPDVPALKDVFKDYFKLGGCNGNQMCGYNDNYADVFWKHFNTTVSNGAFKRDWICRDGYSKPYNFDTADEMMYFCFKNNMTDVVGHCLFSNNGAVEQFSDENGNILGRDAALTVMNDWIVTLINHFNGKGNANEYTNVSYDDYKNWHIVTWDVVNEAAANGSGGAYGIYRADTNTSTSVNFCTLIGTDYVQYAYKYAREADPTAELRYNDAEDWSGKRNNIVQLVKDVNSSNNIVGGRRLIDSVGIQCHITPDFETTHIRDTVNMLLSTGIPLDITEFDMQSHSFETYEAGLKKYENGITRMREFEQAMLYKGCFDVFKEYSSSIGRVVFWTISDKYSYTTSGLTDYLGVFDRNFNPKPQFWAIVSGEEEFYQRYPEAKLLFEKNEWHFEQECDATYSFDMGAWTRAVPDLYETQCVIIKDGAKGGYLRCARRWRTTQNEGIRIKLSNQKFKPGKTYRLTFKTKMEGSNPDGETGRAIYAAFTVPSKVIAENAGAESFITSGTKCGTTKSEWTTYSARITPKASDFENGYTSLYISMPGGVFTNKTTYLCFDDISIK